MRIQIKFRIISLIISMLLIFNFPNSCFATEGVYTTSLDVVTFPNLVIRNDTELFQIASLNGWTGNGQVDDPIKIINKDFNNITISDTIYYIQFINCNFNDSITIEFTKNIQFINSDFSLTTKIIASRYIEIINSTFDLTFEKAGGEPNYRINAIIVSHGSKYVTISSNNFLRGYEVAIIGYLSSVLNITSNTFMMNPRGYGSGHMIDLQSMDYVNIENNIKMKAPGERDISESLWWGSLTGLTIRNNNFYLLDLLISRSNNILIENNQLFRFGLQISESIIVEIFDNYMNKSGITLQDTAVVSVFRNNFYDGSSAIVLERAFNVIIEGNSFHGFKNAVSEREMSNFEIDDNSYENVEDKLRRYNEQELKNLIPIILFLFLSIVVPIIVVVIDRRAKKRKGKEKLEVEENFNEKKSN